MTRVYRKSVIDAPISRVWEMVRDFNSLPLWLPGVTESRIEDGKSSDEPGCVRNFQLASGDTLREQLLELDDEKRRCVYTILESPMALDDYVSEITLSEDAGGSRTLMEWSAGFRCAPDDEEGLVTVIGDNVFLAGMKSLGRLMI